MGLWRKIINACDKQTEEIRAQREKEHQHISSLHSLKDDIARYNEKCTDERDKIHFAKIDLVNGNGMDIIK